MTQGAQARVRSRVWRIGGVHIAAVALAWPQLAWAQAVQPPTREELNVGRPAAQQPPQNRLTVEGGLERGPCPLAEPQFANVKVTFSTVEFSGLPGIPVGALDAAWRDLAGREVPIASLCDVRDRASAILREQGYLVAVQVPPQRIETNGTVKMDVLAAKLVEVELRGDTGPSARLIAAHLDKLTQRPWFNTHEAERELLLLGDLPGYDVRLTLRSAQRAPGEVVGVVQIVRRAVELVAGVQNLGSRQTGREGAFVEAAFNDVLGLGDRTTVSFYNTFDWSEQHILRAAHDLALNADGLRLGGSILFGRTRPGIAGGAFKSETVAGEIHLTDALVRSQVSSLYATGGLEIVDQKLAFGGTPLSHDKLRVVYARLDHQAVDPASILGVGGYTSREPRWRSAAQIELRQGIDVFGASPDCDPLAVCLPPNVGLSNFAADPTAFVARVQGSFEFRPVPHLTVAIAPVAQLAGSALLSYEQISFGSYTVGRGLDPGVVLGDDGIGTSIELRYGSLFPRKLNGFAYEPFVFVDYAKGWIHDRGLNPDPRDVLTAGGGVRARWSDHLDAAVTVAAPLQRAGYQSRRGPARVLFTITARLVPWGDR
jgi:hemolysin activation/secretion protein